MNALLLESKGSLDSFTIGEQPVPAPGNGEIRVLVQAAGLNPVDYKLALGGHPAWDYPFILGLDCAGIVDKTGSGVTEFKKGDRVVYHGNLSRPGCFAEYGITAAHVAARIPEGVSFTDAAAVPCAGYTAYLALFTRLKIKPGTTILIQAGAGGVGGFAVQMAAAHGCKVITTASKRHHEHVRALGAESAIDYHKQSVPDTVLELTDGQGVDNIVDPVGRDTATESMKCLKFTGSIACLVRMPDTTKLAPFGVCPSMHEISLGSAYFRGAHEDQAYMSVMGSAMMDMLYKGTLSPMVSEIIGLDDIPDALKRLEGRHVEGKIVAQVA